MPKTINMAGQRFGRLTAVRQVETIHSEARWLLRCDCGGETITTGSKVRSGYTQSCGCLQREATAKAKYRHGESTGGGRQEQSRLHRIWSLMKQRCTNPKSINWERYGARGIRYCTEWKDYLPFRDWALANGYAPHLTLDRVDNDADYSPANCRWATLSEQALNKRNSRAARGLPPAK